MAVRDIPDALYGLVLGRMSEQRRERVVVDDVVRGRAQRRELVQAHGELAVGPRHRREHVQTLLDQREVLECGVVCALRPGFPASASSSRLRRKCQPSRRSLVFSGSALTLLLYPSICRQMDPEHSIEQTRWTVR